MSNAATRNAAESSKKLLLAAVEVFAEKGPDAATVDEICGRANLNKRMAYHYFQNKSGLYKAALKHVYDQFLSLDVELSSMLLPADELLRTLVQQYYRFLERHPQFVRMIGFENLNRAAVARDLKLEGTRSPIITALKLALEKGQADGRFRRGVDVNDLLLSIFSLCFFYFSNRHTMSRFLGASILTRQHMNQRVEHVVDLLLYGIMKGNGESE